jgi:hypothetical protein
MTVAKYVRGWVLRVVIFTAIAAPAQNAATPAAVDPCKPAATPAGVQKEQKKATGKLSGWLGKAASKATGGAIDAGDVGNLAGSAGSKPTAPCPAKPAAPAVAAPKELCPPNTSRVEGQPYCITPDGNKLVDVIRIPASSSIPAPAAR